MHHDHFQRLVVATTMKLRPHHGGQTPRGRLVGSFSIQIPATTRLNIGTLEKEVILYIIPATNVLESIDRILFFLT